MSKIKFQPFPHVPPITFFEPISISPEDWMSSPEYLLGILKKLNEVIKQTNSNTEFIDKYSGKIEEIEAEVAKLRAEMSEFETEVTESITKQFTEIRIELQSMIATALIQANAYTDSVAAILENEIQNISIGQITAYNPVTGTYDNLQTIIDSLYNSSREDAITAEEYDNLELTATEYDGFQLAASVYDQQGKSVLYSLVSS